MSIEVSRLEGEVERSSRITGFLNRVKKEEGKQVASFGVSLDLHKNRPFSTGGVSRGLIHVRETMRCIKATNPIAQHSFTDDLPKESKEAAQAHRERSNAFTKVQVTQIRFAATASSSKCSAAVEGSHPD